MKFLKIAVAVLFAAVYGNAYAFHSGGVAECEGCHTMHGGATDASGVATELTGGYLLVGGSTQSAACLSCHQSPGDTGPNGYHISTAPGDMPAGVAPLQMTPGGDFGWLKKTYSFVPRSGAATVNLDGQKNGHNIVAPDLGYAAATGGTMAPGGSYPVASLACSSCHDPHGQYRRSATGQIRKTGNPIRSSGSYNTSADPVSWADVGVYRLLAGVGYTPKSLGTNAFTNDPPAAVAPSSYNRSEVITETRVAYGRGMSEWCANCHSEMHQPTYNSGGAGLKHPAGNAAKLGDLIAVYNAYTKSGIAGGDRATSYSSLVPFEEGVADHSVASYAQLKANAVNNGSKTVGPDGNSNVMCLSCHRAHASGFQEMLRFQYGYEFMTNADASGNGAYVNTGAYTQGKTAAEVEAAYYMRPATAFGPYARVLCNKCHAKD